MCIRDRFVPLSEYVNKSRKGYYDAYTLAEENANISGCLLYTSVVEVRLRRLAVRLHRPELCHGAADGDRRAGGVEQVCLLYTSRCV